MRKFLLVLAALVISVLASSYVTPASAQTARTWVSGVGSDAGTCTRTAPCQTFAFALTQTANGGEINCLDSGGFGPLTITQSVSIICDNVEAGVLAVGSGNGIIINSGSNSGVHLSGLDIQGGGSGNIGIQVISGNLRVTNSIIKDFRNGGTSGFGILVAPSSGSSKLAIENTMVIDSAGTVSGAAIMLQPTGGASVSGIMKNLHVTGNGAGVRFDGTGGPVGASMYTVTTSGNQRAAISAIGANPVRVMVDTCTVTGNGTGVVANGSGASFALTRTAVTGNTVGLQVTSGVIASYGDNELDGNGTDGPSPSVATHH